MKPLQTYFLNEFRELFRRERKWLIILPEVARNMPPDKVNRAVTEHLERTAAQVGRLEEIFRLLAQTDQQASVAVRPLLREADEVLAAVTLSSVAARRQAGSLKGCLRDRRGWGFEHYFRPASQN
jgi:ferritin-like metal-binding protein YciE